MIVDTIVGLITTVLTAVFSALPTWSILSALGVPSAGAHDGSAPGTIAGNYMGGFNTLLPLSETLTYLYVGFLAMMAFYVTYKLANWIWRHIPDLGGFGPGAG